MNFIQLFALTFKSYVTIGKSLNLYNVNLLYKIAGKIFKNIYTYICIYVHVFRVYLLYYHP